MTAAGPSSRRAWVLNLDVEYELRHMGGYTRSEAMLRHLRAAAGKLNGLVGPNDVVVDPQGPTTGTSATNPAHGFFGDAWCPTPRALDILRAAGAVVPDAPPLQVLRRVNDRAFAVALQRGDFRSVYVADVTCLAPAVAEITGAWLLKQGLSFAGRGHRRGRGALAADDLRWCTNAMRDGVGVVVEPLVDREQDFAQHGWVTKAGATLLGEPTVQSCDQHGMWQSTAREPKFGPLRLGSEERALLANAARSAGAALSSAGYYGPFGVDAYRYRDAGRRRFNPLVEINARYSMGWPLCGCQRDGESAIEPATPLAD